jgi:5'-deoxynucleotidase YfbR-like HD superfamily hydrolase
MSNLNTYSVVVLGTKGAGKTVYLASLFGKLSISDPRVGFSLQAENLDQRKRLNEYYQQIISSEEDWPRGTLASESEIWSFTAKVDNQPACRFEYLDYSGGLITDQGFDDTGIYRSFLQKSDVIMPILDGTHILALMLLRNQDTKPWITKAVSQFRKNIRNLIQEIQDYEESNQGKNQDKSIHFLITKWDLFDGLFNFTQIKEALLEEPTVNKFLATRKQKRPNSLVRFIPVSSEGIGFSTIDYNTGYIGKKTEWLNLISEPEPLYVEIPLAYALRDKIETYMNQIQNELHIKKETIYDSLQQKLNLTEDVKRGERLGRIAHLFSNISPFFKNRIRNWANSQQQAAQVERKRYYELQEQLKEEFQECLNSISDVSNSFVKIVSIFDDLEKSFSIEFPNSEIIQKDLDTALFRIAQRTNQRTNQ